MEQATTSESPPITVAPRAVEMGKKKLEEERDDEIVGIRVGVRGGGCSGLTYVFDFAKRVRPDKDLVLEFDGLTLVVDRKSLRYLAGSRLEWNDALVGNGFRWENPNAKGGCGCGISFDV